MGHIRHHAITVTSWNSDKIDLAYHKAIDIFPWVSPPSPVATNGYISFFIPPDGSKEGWEESEVGDLKRLGFVKWLDEQRFEDDSSVFAWVEVQYGDDDLETLIINDSDQRRRESNP